MNVLKYSLILIISLFWISGCSKTVMRLLFKHRVIVDDYRYGDLYRLSNLPQFKDPVRPCPPRQVSADSNRTHLYVIGDSFSEPERLSQQDFSVSYFRRVQWEKQDTVQLDPTANNILLIESVERHFREHAAVPIQNFVVVPDSNRTDSPKLKLPNWREDLVEFIRSKGIEERLETALFSHDFFLWFKELKAKLTLSAFNRVSPTVSLSPDQQHVLLALDTDPAKPLNASTSPLSHGEVTAIVKQVNAAAAAYKSLGFDKVLLTIIPNKTTLVDSTRQPYNRLIERVQTDSHLQVPAVDVLSLYRQRPQSVFALGDSHWNCTGRAIWLDAVIRQLR